MEEKLTLRAKQSLKNEAEITQELVKIALKEAKDLTKNKPLAEPMLLDLAYFRLKLLLKIEPTELDLILMKEALKAAEKIDEQGGDILTNTKFGMRVSEFK